MGPVEELNISRISRPLTRWTYLLEMNSLETRPAHGEDIETISPELLEPLGPERPGFRKGDTVDGGKVLLGQLVKPKHGGKRRGAYLRIQDIHLYQAASEEEADGCEHEVADEGAKPVLTRRDEASDVSAALQGKEGFEDAGWDVPESVVSPHMPNEEDETRAREEGEDFHGVRAVGQLWSYRDHAKGEDSKRSSVDSR